MQQSNQEIYTNQTDEINLVGDEINLVGLINFFAARKFFIFGFTGFVTVLAILVSLTLTPTYHTSSSFTSPSKSSILSINKLNSLFFINKLNDEKKDKVFLVDETKDTVFAEFLTQLSSRDLQTRVFVAGDYLTKFNNGNNPIDDVDAFIARSIASVSVNSPSVTQKDKALGFLTELPYSVSMEGSNVEVMSRYLNELVATADKKTIDKFIKIIKQNIDYSLEEISIESRLLLIKAKQERLNEIEVLTEASKLARSLGLIEHNFQLVNNDQIYSTSPILFGKREDVPEWYLYGEKALLQRVDLLKSRTSDNPFIPELVDLNNKKIKLEAAMVDSIGFKSMQLNQVAIPLIDPIKPNKRLIVLIAFFGSFILSILSALVMNVLKPDDRHST